MDSIEICGLSCRCIIGIRPRERRVAQRVRLDIELFLDLERAGKSGRIAHTVDYSRASTEIIALLMFRRYSLLEVAAEECSGWLFAAYPSVRMVKLSIAKPQALAGQAESGSVHITRERPLEPARQAREFGFIQPQLETSEADISLVGLDAGKVLSLAALRAESALVLPLSGRLEAARPLLAHEPARLAPGEACRNTDAVAGLLVVCAQRAGGGQA
jgi:7,8-dihydroneopterin aldolase/epimerase/oxygenase